MRKGGKPAPSSDSRKKGAKSVSADVSAGNTPRPKLDLSKIRHDLRTPINHIIGYCEMLQEEEQIPRSFRADLGRIHEGGRQLLTLINEYFDEDKFEVKRRDLRQLYHDLRTPVNHIIGYSEMLQEHATDLGRKKFIPDLQRIHAAATTWLALMEEHLLPSNLETEDGTFLPDASLIAAPRITPGVGFHTPTPRSADISHSAQGTLLIVDDDEANRDMLSRRLRHHGYTASTAASGLEALKMVRSQKFDLVLLDLIMPGIDGYQVLAKMKADAALRHIPVIMISALDQAMGVARCIEMGAEDYLAKPFNPVFLRARIGACLEKKRLRDQEQQTHQALVESQRKLASELAEAAAYVKSLLPQPLTGPVNTEWCFQPSTQLGGDSFGYHWLDSDHFAMYLLDVCGHGVGAALLSVSVMNVLRSQALPATNFHNPGAVLNALNQTFKMENQNNMYFTIWYGVYDRAKQVLLYASGGHPPAILITEAGPPTAVQLRTSAPAIGCMEKIKYESASVAVGASDRLWILSDGVYEVSKPDGTMLTFNEFVDHLVNSSHMGGATPESSLHFVQRLHGAEVLEDDFSLIQVTFGAQSTPSISARSTL